MADEVENLSDEDLFLEQSNEINSKEKSLSDVQRMEIRRRYDLSVAIGMRAHRIKDEIKIIKSKVRTDAKTLDNYENFLIVFFALFLVLKYGVNGLVSEFVTRYEWLMVPLFAFWLYIFFQKKYDKAINKLQSNFIELEIQWDSCNPYYRLEDYIDKRQANNIDASDRGDFTLVAIGLRKSIVGRVDFQYTWC